MLDLVDTHAHLAEQRQLIQLADVLARAVEAGVGQVVMVGTTLADSLRGLELCRTIPGIFPTAGIHPNHVAEANPGDWDELESFVRRGGVVALGETGLDRHWDRTPFPMQQAMFQRHLDLAHELNLPVIIHSRQCEHDLIDQLQALGRPVRGVLHSFTGTEDHARAFLDLGLHISFAGMVTFKNPSLNPLRETAKLIPADRILIETDSPYLSPHPYRGKVNEPARVVETLKVLAEVREIPVNELGPITTANARALFGLPGSERLIRPEGAA